MNEERTKDVTPAPAPPRGMSRLDELERSIERWLDLGWMRAPRWERLLWEPLGEPDMRIPRVNVIDRDKELVVRAEVPGVAREDLDVSVTDNTVTIKGETRREAQQEAGEYHRQEISRGAFTRTVGLPSEVDADKAEARFQDGVLELTLPKVKEARRRRVEVK